MMRKMFVRAAAFGAAMSFGAMAFAQDLFVGANVGNVPWELQDDTGAIVGFEIELRPAA